ncbi:helix-turn-helix domain-containing protein [Burkholderia glumae]|uniref:helix-turn-helix domain-containing protein n=1 Tax=Burkholderia glumae TaxID=337 RepID=UPI0018AF6779|nr:helix-turn-helix domain-containing protein [Burkholderia glumae]
MSTANRHKTAPPSTFIESSDRETTAQPDNPLSPPMVQCETSALPVSDRFAIWREALSNIFDVSLHQTAPGDTFFGSLTAYHLGPVLLGECRTSAQRYFRSPVMIRRDDIDHYLIQLYISGEIHGLYGSKPTHLTPMTLSVLDMSRPVDSLGTPLHNINLLIPRDLLAPLIAQPNHMHGRIWTSDAATTALAASHLVTLFRLVPTLDSSQLSAVVDVTVNLIAICLGSGEQAREALLPQRDAISLRMVRRYIRRHIRDMTLSPASLSTALGISRSRLYRLFKGEGGVHEYIRSSRMRLALKEISDSKYHHRRIGDIAYEIGFTNEAHFSRSFREKFGMSPKEAREGARRGDKGLLSALDGASRPGNGNLPAWVSSLDTP